MIKCSKCKTDSAGHTISVRTCPNCGRILEAKQFIRLLKTLGFSKKTIEKIKKELTVVRTGNLPQ